MEYSNATTVGNTQVIHDVWHIPGVKHNLLSVERMIEAGLQITFHETVCTVYELDNTKHIVAHGMKKRRLFELMDWTVVPQHSTLSVIEEESNLWYLLYGHPHRIKRLSEHKLVEGIPKIIFSLRVYECCLTRK